MKSGRRWTVWDWMVERSSLCKPVKIIEDGKLVIPAAMRGALGIARGDMVVVELLSDGELRVRPLASPIREAQAIVRKLAQGPSQPVGRIDARAQT